MRVDATLEGQTLDVSATGRVDEFDLADLTGIDALTGTLSGNVDTVVRFDDLDAISVETVDVDGTVTLVQPTLMDVPFRQVTADVRLDRGVLDVRSLAGTGDGFSLTGQGPIAFGATGSSNFSYRLDASSIVDPAKIAALPMTGAAVTEGTITGPRDAFRASGTLQGTTVAYGDIVSAGDVTAEYTVDVPDFDPTRLRVGSSVSATTLVVAGVPLETAAGEVTYVPDELAFDATAGDAMRTVRGAGTMAFEEGRQVLALTALALERDAVQWTLAAGQTARVTITPDAVEIAPVSLAHGSQTILLDGRVAIDDATRNALTVTATGVDISEALLLAGQEHDVDGIASLTARVGGTRAVPTVSGHVDIRDARYRDMPIAAIDVTVEDDGRVAEVDALVRQSDQAYVTAKGTVPRTLLQPPAEAAVVSPADDRLDLEIHSTQIDLRLAEGLTEQVSDLSGRAQVDIRLTNTGRVPVVDGEVTLSNAGFLVTATGVTYSNVNGTLDFADDRVIVRQLTADSREGRTLQVSGEVGLRNAQRGNVALAIAGKGVRVLDNGFGQVDLDSTLTVTGTLTAPVIEGDLVVTSGRLDIDAILPRVSTSTYATEAAYQGIPTYPGEDALPVVPNILGPQGDDERAPGDPPRPSRTMFVYEDMALNVRVRIPDNLVLRGRDVEMGRSRIGDVNVTMGGDFRVAKTPGEPLVLIGAVNTVRGTYSYQGRRFEIARDGQVLFRGDGTTNPSLDITAERVIQGVEARVRIQGTARNPTLSLSSDPPLDQADVLALIVFNQPVNQLGTGQQNSLAERAGGIAAGFAVSPIAQALGDTFDLDLFDVETTDPSGRVNPAIVIGQQVDQNLFVKFRQQFGNQQVSQFLLEYRLADFLRLQANFAEGEGLARANRSLTQRIERYGTDLVFYFAF
jgi:translocation and assembly module TamB